VLVSYPQGKKEKRGKGSRKCFATEGEIVVREIHEKRRKGGGKLPPLGFP